MSTVKRRVAAKSYRCERCTKLIEKGDVHLRVTVFPGDIFSKITVLRVCAKCGISSGHDRALDDIPYAQLARDGLL